MQNRDEKLMPQWSCYAIGAADLHGRHQVFSIVSASLILGLLCGCQRSQSGPEPKPALASPATVQVVRPHRGQITRSITLPAEIRAYQQATLYAKVAGYLKT